MKSQSITALVLVLVASPAAAQRYFVTVGGQLRVTPSPTPIPELAQFADQGFFASFVVDTRAATFVPTGPLSGHGDSGLWNGSVSSGFAAIFAPGGGTVSFSQNASDPGSLFLINDAGVPGTSDRRIDQAVVSSAVTRFSAAGPEFLYDQMNSTGFAGLPADVRLGALSFGRSQLATLPALPALLADLGRPDFGALLQSPGGTSPFLSLRFRRGTATNQADWLALPAQSLSSSNIGVSVSVIPDQAVPEPASWAMLVIGFGLIGAVVRRRRLLLA